MADPRSIHEFTTGQVEATTLLLGDFVDLDAQSGYTTLKMSVSDLGEVLLEDIEYTQDLLTVDKTIVGAINENKSVIGYSYDAYDATTAYSTGDLCIYNNTLYKAKQATTGNLPTNTTYWEPTSIADEINKLKNGVDANTTRLTNFIVSDTVYDQTVTITMNSPLVVTMPNKTGYTAIGLGTTYAGGSSSIMFVMDTANRIHCRNISGVDFTGKVTIKVVYVKN